MHVAIMSVYGLIATKVIFKILLSSSSFFLVRAARVLEPISETLGASRITPFVGMPVRQKSRRIHTHIHI